MRSFLGMNVLVSEVELKLKQASAVLGVDPKDLQNLVQFKVLYPKRRDSVYWFDNRLLLTAKIAFYLKESLGTSTEMLARFAQALAGALGKEKPPRLRYVWLRSRPAGGQEPVEVRIPLANLAHELDERLPRAAMYRDLPRGRKRPGWQGEAARKLEAAAESLSGVTEAQILETVRTYRSGKRQLPEVTVGGPKSST